MSNLFTCLSCSIAFYSAEDQRTFKNFHGHSVVYLYRREFELMRAVWDFQESTTALTTTDII